MSNTVTFTVSDDKSLVANQFVVLEKPQFRLGRCQQTAVFNAARAREKLAFALSRVAKLNVCAVFVGKAT